MGLQDSIVKTSSIDSTWGAASHTLVRAIAKFRLLLYICRWVLIERDRGDGSLEPDA